MLSTGPVPTTTRRHHQERRGLRPRMVCTVAAACSLLFGNTAAAQYPGATSQPVSAPTLTVPRVAAPPTVDDVIAARWPAAGQVRGFRQRVPGDGTPESRNTVAFIAHDGQTLYVGFRCETPANMLRARMAPREDIDDDDRVTLYLDTFRNQQRAWAFSSNAFGVQQDALLAEGEEVDPRFDTVWHTEARRTLFGFVVLMKVPFASLRFAPGEAHTWGLALGRVSPGLSEEVFWPYVTNRIEGFTNQMADATLQGIVTGRNLLFVPYGAVTEGRSLDANQQSFTPTADRRLGMDAKAVVQAFTLDASLNPDFSHVTPDEPQVTINQRFELFYPERRPFFLENADYFAATDQLFFSRRVRDPRLGLRLTGRVGGWTIGALGASDRAVETDAASGHTAVGVLRVQHDVGEQSRISFVGTSRRGPSGDNVVVGSDVRLKLSPTWVLTALAAASDTRRLDTHRSRGSDVVAELVRSGRGFNYLLSYLDRSPDFDAPLGFVPRVNIREIEQEVRYAWYPATRWLRTIEPAIGSATNWNHQGQPLDWYVAPTLNLGLFNALDVQLYRTEEQETYQGLVFRQHATSLDWQDASLAWLGMSGGVSRGQSVNFEPADGTAPFLATSTDASIGLTWRPLHRLRIQETYFYSRLGLRDGARVFDNQVMRTNTLVQFTRALSVRAIVDYTSVVSDTRYSAQPSGKRLTGDVLVTYQVDPFTAVYIGYTDLFENIALDGGRPTTVGRTRAPRTSTERQLFVKTSFALRF